MHHTFPISLVTYNFANKVLLCNLPVDCIHQEYNILMGRTNTVCVPVDPASTCHLGRKLQNFENSILTLGCFSLNAMYMSFKFHNTNRFCLYCFFQRLHNLFYLAFVCYTHHPHKNLKLAPRFLLTVFFRVSHLA